MSDQAGRRAPDTARPCAHCGQPVRMKAATAKYCNAACRISASTARRAERERPAPPKGDAGE